MRFGGMRPGMTVYEVTSKKTANGPVIEISPIKIASCDQVKKTVVGKNKDGLARLYREADYKSWRARKPVIVINPETGLMSVKQEENTTPSIEMNLVAA